MSIDKNTLSANAFYREIQRFASTTKQPTPAYYYQVKPDERHDLTLVSQRVYGNRYEFLAVMAAANVDRSDAELREQLLVLPLDDELRNIKRRTGFESRPAYREDYQPTWV
jgi:hypothetical protein